MWHNSLAFILPAGESIRQLVLFLHSPAWFQYALLFQPGICDQYEVPGVLQHGHLCQGCDFGHVEVVWDPQSRTKTFTDNSHLISWCVCFLHFEAMLTFCTETSVDYCYLGMLHSILLNVLCACVFRALLCWLTFVMRYSMQVRFFVNKLGALKFWIEIFSLKMHQLLEDI